MRRIFTAPTLDHVEQRVLEMIDQLRDDLRHRVAEPRRWVGNLRRMTLARAVQGSNSIEGYDASLDDVAATVDGEPTLEATEETQQALMGYRDAMTYVLQVAADPAAVVDEGLIKALHFMMLKHDITKWPGRWRPGYIAVRNEASGEVVYVAPDADRIPELIQSMLSEVADDSTPTVVRAATAHLNLVMIHPFRDGNGRMARCLQTLVLARDQILAPVFSGVEEYLGRNTQAYYDALAEVGQGAWHPERDARSWVRFMLTAHYRQAKTHMRRIEEIETIFTRCVDMAERHRLPQRTASGLVDVAFGLRLRRNTYLHAVEASMGEEISELTATRDLQAMVRVGLLTPRGETRGRYYVAGEPIVAIRKDVRRERPPRTDYDPFVAAQRSLQLSLDAPPGSPDPVRLSE